MNGQNHSWSDSHHHITIPLTAKYLDTEKTSLKHDATKNHSGQSELPPWYFNACIYEPINTKNILRPTSLPEMTNKVFLCIIEHLPLVAQQCYLDGWLFIYSLVSYHVLQLIFSKNWPIIRNGMRGQSYVLVHSMAIFIIFYNKKFADKMSMDLDISTFC